MEHVEGNFEGRGSLELFWQAWLPDAAQPKAVVVLAHGASEHSSRYAHAAERLTAAGYAVYALDHRGHGRSEGPRARVDRMSNVVADLRDFIALARSRHPDKPLFLLGHSMGGAVAIEYALHHQEEIAGLVLSAPAAALEAASPATRVISRVLSAVAPGLGVFDIDASGVSRDPAVVRDYEADPLNHHGKLPARTVAELAGAVGGFHDGAPTLRVPLLVMHGTADRIAPPAGSQMIHDRAGSSDKSIELYDGLYHEILNEPEQDRVIADVVAWLDARAGG